MKKITIAIIALLGMYSCTEDFITKDPLGVSSSASYYKVPDQCQLSVNAIYDPLGWFEFHDEYLWKIGDICSDDCERGGANSLDQYTTGDDWDKSGQLCVFEATDRSSIMSGMWKAGYVAIGRANAMLAGSEGVDNAEIKTMRAEVKFLRAWYYFQLTKVFGPVILSDKFVSVAEAADLGNRADGDSDGSKQVRAQYDFIISELESIIKNDELPVTANAFGKVTKGAAQAFLTKAYLYRAYTCGTGKGTDGDFQKAHNVAKDIINSGTYALEPHYQDLFDIFGSSFEQSKEVIFSVQHIAGTQYGRDGDGSIIPLYVAPRYLWDPIKKQSQIEDGLGYGFAIPTQNLLDEFEAGDPRATMIVASPHGDATIDATITKLNLDTAVWASPTNTGDKTEGWYAIGKVSWSTGYYNMKKSQVSPLVQERNPQCAGKDNIILRYGDVLLMAAEAAAQLGEEGVAAGYLNQLRQRANNSARTIDYTKDGMTSACYTYTPTTALADLSTADTAAVKHERRVEMYGEAERYWDLVRWGDTKKFRTEDISGTKFQYNEATMGRWPIPQEQIILHTGGNLKQNPGY